MEIRTDLAVESKSLEHAPEELPKGVILRKEQRHGVEATVVELRTERAARAVGKPRGTYVTVELGRVLRRERDSFDRAVYAVADYLREMLALPAALPVLVAGLGNRDVTPDAVGPLTADHILVTRHMLKQMPREFGDFRPVSAVVPGVLGTTGVESAETIHAVAKSTGAAAVIAVDAIAARDLERLCGTVQLSDTGIVPGSGIGNSRSALNRQALGLPVIALGVPTVTDAATMAADLMERAGGQVDEAQLRRISGGMVVTSSDIDRRVREVSRVLAYAVNHALQPEVSLEDLADLTF